MANIITTTLADIGGLLFPGLIMSITAVLFFITALLNPKLLLTFQIEQLQFKTFAIFWSRVGSKIAKDWPADLSTVVDQHCHGEVLDIGPGTGCQLHRFQKAFEAGKIKQIYGIEPCEDMHDRLREKATEVFNGKNLYTIINAGAQPDQLIPALNKAGFRHKKFDTIVCLRALCGIPQPRETAKVLYGLLKPGGYILVLEHVVSERTVPALFQRLYTLLGWRFWNGGCDLRRDTMQTLKDAAGGEGWADVKVFRRYEDKVIPEIYGYLKKR